MRASTAVLCFSVALGLCAMGMATASLFRSEPAAPEPVRQNVFPDVAPAVANSSSAATPPAAATPRESVRPTVTLKEQRISIQTAATQVCAQAGMRYDFNRSREKTGDKCRLFIQVNLENATLDEALAQIVLKNGLRYRIEGQALWLETPDQ